MNEPDLSNVKDYRNAMRTQLRQDVAASQDRIKALRRERRFTTLGLVGFLALSAWWGYAYRDNLAAYWVSWSVALVIGCALGLLFGIQTEAIRDEKREHKKLAWALKQCGEEK